MADFFFFLKDVIQLRWLRTPVHVLVCVFCVVRRCGPGGGGQEALWSPEEGTAGDQSQIWGVGCTSFQPRYRRLKLRVLALTDFTAESLEVLKEPWFHRCVCFSEQHSVGFSQSSLIHLVGPLDCTLHNYVHGGQSLFLPFSSSSCSYHIFRNTGAHLSFILQNRREIEFVFAV